VPLGAMQDFPCPEAATTRPGQKGKAAKGYAGKAARNPGIPPRHLPVGVPTTQYLKHQTHYSHFIYFLSCFRFNFSSNFIHKGKREQQPRYVF